MGLDEVKAFLGEKGRVSKKGFYSGILLGRPAGGYSGLKAGDYIFPDSEILQIYPSLDLGSFGTEEQIVYTGIAGGYLLGGYGLAKAVTKYQEFEEDDLEYRRPFLLPFEGVKSIKSFLEAGEDEEITNNVDPEALENLFEEEDEK